MTFSLIAIVGPTRKFFLHSWIEEKEKPSVHLDCADIYQHLVDILGSMDGEAETQVLSGEHIG